LEVHLALIHKVISDYEPTVVVIDPITNFLAVGDESETKAMLTRLIDFLKTKQITAIFNSLTGAADHIEDSEVGVSSLMDAWLLVKNVESNGEHNRGLYILKARGMAHSNQVREFVLTDHGVELLDAYVGTEGVLMGSARAAQLSRETAAQINRKQATRRKERELKRRQEVYEAQLAALTAQYESERGAMLKSLEEDQIREKYVAKERVEMARLRRADNGAAIDGHIAEKKSRKGVAG
jgi:circadian clock protein KaiC